VNMAAGHQATSGGSGEIAQMAMFWAFAEASVRRS